jgi:two-component system response regulator
VLYVDDNPDDVLFLQEATRMAAAPLIIECASGPAAAIDYLDDIAQIADRQTYAMPSLALLDCHFQAGGRVGLIEWLRAAPRFNSLPIVIFSGSDAPDQIARCYSRGADHFLVKPTTQILLRLTIIVQALHEYVASNPRCCELLVQLPEYRANPNSPLRRDFSSLLTLVQGTSPPPTG